MSLTHRVTLLLLLVFAVCTLGLYTVIRQSMLPAFSKLDEDLAAVNQSLVEEYIQAQRIIYRDWALNYAVWTDTYLFTQGQNPEYLESNLSNVNEEEEDNSVFAIIDRDKRIVTFMAYGDHSESIESMQDVFPDVDRFLALLQMDDMSQAIEFGTYSGIEHPVMFAALPILTSDFEGPAMGILLTARLIDEQFVQDMANRLAIDVKIWNAQLQSFNALLRSHGYEEQAFDDSAALIEGEQLHQFRQFHNVLGEPAFVTEVVTERNVLRFGEETIAYVLLLQLTLLLVVIAGLWLVLNRSVISRVKLLQQHITTVREEDDLSRRIEISESDEVGEVATAFNALTCALQTAREESETAREAALQAADFKSQFLANMSHEIRTPMNGLMGLISLLKEIPYDEHQLEYLNMAGEASQSLMEILNDILDVSKIDASMLDLETVDLNLIELVEGIVELQQANNGKSNVELGTYFSPDVPQFIKADPTRLGQVLTKLLSNAIKFTPVGEIVIVVEQPEASMLRFSIRDTGIGIEAENQSTIFDSFTQADDSTTRQFGGVGLGLSLCKSLVNLMGGEIGLESAPGEGSTFWFTLELKEASELAALPLRVDSPDSMQVILVSNSELIRTQFDRYCECWKLSNICYRRIREIKPAILNAERQLVFFLDANDVLEASANAEILNSIIGDKHRRVAICSLEDPRQRGLLTTAGYVGVITKPLGSLKLKRLIEDNNDPEQSAQQLPIASAQPDSDAKQQVLLVEDNEVNQQVATGMLAKLGCAVDIADNGQLACDMLARRSYDLVFMDFHMPVLDGLEATRRIRKRERSAGMPSQTIIAMTADTDLEHKDASREAGMDDHIGKPLNMEKLRKVIETWTSV